MAAIKVMRGINKLFTNSKVTPISLCRGYAGYAMKPEDIQEYREVFPEVIDEMVRAGAYGSYESETKYSMAHFRKAMDYNLQLGNESEPARMGVWFVNQYKHLAPHAKQQDIRAVQKLAWVCEIWPKYLTMTEDVVNDRPVRDGQPAWHTQIDESLMALHDAVLLQNTVYDVVKNHFSYSPCYTHMMELFHESGVLLTTGHELSVRTNVESFSAQIMHHIHELKAGTLCRLAMKQILYAAGISDVGEHKELEALSVAFGQWRQEQDDVTNCYGETDMVGSDIAENKCTWLAVRALEKANPKQRQILQDNYGAHEPQKVDAVRGVYDELHLNKEARLHQSERFSEVTPLIDNYSGALSKALFKEHATYMMNRKYMTAK